MIRTIQIVSCCFSVHFFLLIPLAVAQEVKEKKQVVSKQTKKDPALDQYFVANAAFNRKLYPVAVSQFEAFLEKNALHSKADLARRGLALSLYALKQYEKAIPHLATLLKEEKLDPTISRQRLVMLYGQCLMISGKRSEARTLFLTEIAGLKEKSYRGAALAAICDVSFSEGKWIDVEKWSVELLASKPAAEGRARALYQQGYAKYQLKKPDEAVLSLVGIGELEANKLWSTRANYLLGECYNTQKQYTKAEQAFMEALPNLGQAEAIECHYRLGVTRFILKKYSKSVLDFSQYLETAAKGKHVAEVKLYIARANLEGKEFEEAESAFAELAEGEGSVAARASLWHARVFTRNDKNYDRAAEVLADAIDRFAESALISDLRFDYANALMGQSEPDWKSALALFQTIEKDEKFQQAAELINQQSVCQHRLSDYEASLAYNEKFIIDFPDHSLVSEALFMKAENLFLLKRLNEAAAAYGFFLKGYPDHSNQFVAQYRSAQIDHGQGRWAECLSVARPLLKKEPRGPLFVQLGFIVGDCLFRLAQWEDAIIHLQNFSAAQISEDEVSTIANLDTALMQLAVAYERVGDDSKAMAQLAVLVGRYPNPTPHLPLALAEQGRLAYESGDFEAARLALERFVAEDAKLIEPFQAGAEAQRPRVMYYLGWVDASQGKHDSAATNFEKVLELDAKNPLAPDAALQQGFALVNVGNFKSASQHFLGILENYPKHGKLARVTYYAGLSLARQSHWEEATLQFSKLIENYPESAFADRALYELAWCKRGSQSIEESAQLYEKLLKEYPKSSLVAKVQSELAELNLKGGNTEKVITQLTDALEGLKQEALRADIRYQLASAHLRAGDYKTAVVQFEAMLIDYPKSKLLPRILFNAGECRLKLGEVEPARVHFSAAAKVPGSADALSESITMRLGETQSGTGKHAEAKVTFAGFLERFTESRWLRNALFGLALATELGGDPALAVPEYQKLVATDSSVDLWSVRARYQMGLCYFSLEKYDKALIEFINLEINYPQYPSWQAKSVFEVGRVLLAQKKTAQAVERFKDVLTRFKDDEASMLARTYLERIGSQ